MTSQEGPGDAFQVELPETPPALDLEPIEWVTVETPPGPLYHYTNGQGLLGIVGTGRIYATHFRYLNDLQELVAGSAVLSDVLRCLLVAPDISRRGLQPFFQAWSSQHERNPIHLWYEPYIASFSEEGNLLSQWRAYGDNGAGFSLGVLMDAVSSHLNANLARCEYDEGVFRAHAKDVFEQVAQRMVKRLLSCDAGDRAAIVESAMAEMAVNTALLVIRFKGRAFREEREWRLVVFPSTEDPVRFRATARGITPYLEVALGSSGAGAPLTHAYVGPTQHAGNGVGAVKLLLKSAGHENATVEASGIPFRS